MQRKQLILIVAFLSGMAILAVVSGLLTNRSKSVRESSQDGEILRCAYDGTAINPLYEVDAYLIDNSVRRFCSVHNATRWLKHNRDTVLYLTVADEITGERFDSTLGHFVESDIITVPEVQNRVHVFFSKEDARKHADQFNGRVIENPFGRAFELPNVARLDKLTVGAPQSPDALPLRLGIFRPIFKENKLNVKVVPFSTEADGAKLLETSAVDAIVCDLPTAVMVAGSSDSARIVKNVLRANPFRPLFGLVSRDGNSPGDISQLTGKTIALPKGVSSRFYLEFYLKQAAISPDKLTIREVDTPNQAWEALNRAEVSAALLRSPYTDLAMATKMTFLADDRSLPWMSVLVATRKVIETRSEAFERFIFSLEQSVLALNLKPDEFATLLREQGGVPGEAGKNFPMPIFEGANAPSEDELSTITTWLTQSGHLASVPKYSEIVNTGFLPNPDDVGLAFCCR